MPLNILNTWTKDRFSWAILFVSSSCLFGAALYFQHVLEHAPCVMCIYQRTAVLGIMLASIVPLIMPNSITRLYGYLGWGLSSAWGFTLASEHLSVLTAPNPFFAPCPIVPNFPIPLYDYLPSIFGAPGDCLDQSWQFLGLGMPAWMQIIFALYFIAWIAFVVVKMAHRKLHRRNHS